MTSARLVERRERLREAHGGEGPFRPVTFRMRIVAQPDFANRRFVTAAACHGAMAPELGRSFHYALAGIE